MLHVELHADGRTVVDGAVGPVAPRVREAKAHGTDVAILLTERDAPLTFGAVVDVAREIQDAGIRALALAIVQPPPPPPPEGLALEAAWKTCAKDADCTYATLGCCAVTPVNRRHLAAARARLGASGLTPCPPKTACGPSAAGTWDGALGKCRSGLCAQPSAL